MLSAVEVVHFFLLLGRTLSFRFLPALGIHLFCFKSLNSVQDKNKYGNRARTILEDVKIIHKFHRDSEQE